MFKLRFTRNFGLDRNAVNRTAYVIMNNWGARALQFMKQYPPQRNPDSVYVRGFGIPPNQRVSEDLGARWVKKLRQKARKTTLIIGNNASYAQYVQSRELQAQIHRDWWQTEYDMIEQLFPILIDEFERFLPTAIVTRN